VLLLNTNRANHLHSPAEAKVSTSYLKQPRGEAFGRSGVSRLVNVFKISEAVKRF
jgi:hypothetical protein